MHCTRTVITISDDERQRYENAFNYGGSVIAIVEGAKHRFVFINDLFRQLIGQREVVGCSVAECLQEAASQGYVALLDEVFSSGERRFIKRARFAVQPTTDGPVLEHVHVDLTLQPVTDAFGRTSGILMEGSILKHAP